MIILEITQFSWDLIDIIDKTIVGSWFHTDLSESYEYSTIAFLNIILKPSNQIAQAHIISYLHFVGVIDGDLGSLYKNIKVEEKRAQHLFYKRRQYTSTKLVFFKANISFSSTFILLF